MLEVVGRGADAVTAAGPANTAKLSNARWAGEARRPVGAVHEVRAQGEYTVRVEGVQRCTRGRRHTRAQN